MKLTGLNRLWTADVTGATGTDGYWVNEFREAACGELNAFVSRVDEMDKAAWRRPTPCVGWTVRRLVEHVTDAAGYSWYANFLRRARLEVQSEFPSWPPHDTQSDAEVAALLRQSAAEYADELSRLDDAAADRLEKGGRRGLETLYECVVEFALHRADLDIALGHPLVFSDDVAGVLALSSMRFVPTAARPAPTADVSYVLAGDDVGLVFSFTAGEAKSGDHPTQNGIWTAGAIHDNRCTITGPDVALCLVAWGRLSTHDPMLLTSDGFEPVVFYDGIEREPVSP